MTSTREQKVEAGSAGGWLFVAHADTGSEPCGLTWCATVPEVIEAVKAACFFYREGEQWSIEHLGHAHAIADQLLTEGSVNFEGDPPLSLIRVDHAGQAARLARLQLPRACHDVIAERRRQVALGFDAGHDDGYTAGELPQAAASYLAAVIWPQIFKPANPPIDWPWTADWWKPRAVRDNLVRAAALTIAEIERLDRQAAQLEQLHRTEGGVQHG